MLKFARIESGLVAEIIERPNTFIIADSFHTDLISDSLGGNAGVDEGFVEVLPFSRPVNESDLFSGGVFTPAPPLPVPDPIEKQRKDRVEQQTADDPTWDAWVKRQARIESKTERQIRDELKAELPDPPLP